MRVPAWRRAGWLGMAVLLASGGASTALAEGVPGAALSELERRHELNVSEWLMKVHEASRRRAYVGTFVVSAGGYMSSARIWHVCDGEQQVERVETLTGPPRSTFRRNDQVMTFLPESQIVVAEKRDTLGLFPNLLQSTDSSIARYYQIKPAGRERVAGYEADVVHLRPQDRLRFAYRVWTERKTGLLIKLQTLDAQNQVLEQAAFSELKLDAPVSAAALTLMMGRTDGYQVEKPRITKTTSEAEGWTIKKPVPGFKSMSCFNRTVAVGDGVPEPLFQWIFSDGLASVSLFVGAYDAARHGPAASSAMGATHTLTRRLGDWWVTGVGEVPAATLALLVNGLERLK